MLSFRYDFITRSDIIQIGFLRIRLGGNHRICHFDRAPSNSYRRPPNHQFLKKTAPGRYFAICLSSDVCANLFLLTTHTFTPK